MAEHNDLGRWGERQAAGYLERKGYTIVERNWKYGHRDLDIIAIDNGTLVFVEVKTRRNTLFTEAEQAVDKRKIKSLCIAANAFIKTHRTPMSIRFDIVTVIGTDANCDIRHIPDAFIPQPF